KAVGYGAAVDDRALFWQGLMATLGHRLLFARKCGRTQSLFASAGRHRNCGYIRPMQLERQALEAEAQRGFSALQSGDFATARDAFRHVTASPSASAQAWLFYAQACEGLDDRDNLLVALDRVLESHQGNPFALLMKGDLFARAGDDRAAV